MARKDPPFSMAKFEKPKEKLKPGDVVRLASGGEAMTVSGGGNEIVCVWHTDKGKPRQRRYPKEALLVRAPTWAEKVTSSQ